MKCSERVSMTWVIFTSSMNSTTDIITSYNVGPGVAGLSTVLHTARRSWRSLERNTDFVYFLRESLVQVGVAAWNFHHSARRYDDKELGGNVLHVPTHDSREFGFAGL
eukprot:scaffold114033_cov49-Attheya_sp.AAC.2